MPNRLAITWEHDRLTLLSANIHGGSARLEHAEMFVTDSAQKQSLAAQVAAWVQENRLQKSELLVVMNRSDVEVRPMLFPPVPIEELPDLVSFQASKEFNGYDPAGPLDFFLTNKLENVSRSTLFPALSATQAKSPASTSVSAKNAATPGAPKHLLAATLRASTLKKIEDFCTETNLTLHKIVLRPCETAFLLRQSAVYEPGRCVLLVELDADETSQAVLVQGQPVFMRSPRIACPENVGSADFAARLSAELKRTRMAVRNEIQGVAIDEVVLCGVGAEFTALAQQVSDALEIPVKNFDPWQGRAVTLGDALAEKLTAKLTGTLDRPERFATLIGALLRDAKEEPSEIDFCHPTRRPEPVGQRRLMTGGLALALVLFIALIGYGFYASWALDKELRALSDQKAALTKTAASVSAQRAQVSAIENWQADNVDWFAQLDWLSRKAPPAQEMILTELTLSADDAGSMRLKSLLKDASIVSPMEEQLREGNHDIKTGEKRENSSAGSAYGFLYDLTVSLSSENKSLQAPATKNEVKP